MKKIILPILFALMLFGVIGVVSATRSSPSLDPSMVLYYHFNNQSAYGENSTYVYDFSGTGNNGTVTNTLFQAGTGILSDGSFNFNGVNSTINVTDNPSLNFGTTTNYTFSVWIKTPVGNPASNGFLIGHSGQGVASAYDLYLTTGGTLSSRVGVGGDNVTSSIATVTDGNWHLVNVVMKRGSTQGVQIYVDGLPSGTPIDLSTKVVNMTLATQFDIGYRPSGNYLNANLDDMIVYNRSLSQAEIWTNYLNYISCITPYVGMGLSLSNVTYPLCANNYNLNSTTSGMINANADNIILDCQGSNFTGNWTTGASNSGAFFDVRSKNNVTLKNCNANNYYLGVYSSNNNQLSILNSNINHSRENIYGFNNTNLLVNNSIFNNADVSNIYFDSNYNNFNFTITNNQFFNAVYYAVSLKTGNYTTVNVSGNTWHNGGLEFYNINGASIHNNSESVFDNSYPVYLSNSKNIDVFNENYTNSLYIYVAYGSDNVTIRDSKFYNCSKNACVVVQSGNSLGYINVSGNNMNLSDKAIYAGNSNNVNIVNNVIDDMSTNYDGYNTGIELLNTTNVLIQGNNGTRIGCLGILMQRTLNTTIKNNSLSYDVNNNILKKTNCAREPATGIASTPVYKTWISDSSEQASDNYTNKIYLYNNTNVIISGNNITGFPVLLRAQDTYGLTHDLTNFWFRSIRNPYLLGKDDFYISNSFDNISNTYAYSTGNPVAVNYIMGYGWRGSTTNIYFNFSFSKTSDFYQLGTNTNYSTVYLYNITNNFTVKDVTNNQYLFTSTSASRNSYNMTMAINSIVQSQDYSCTVPYDGMSITSSTTLCQGTYYLNGSASGALSIGANNVTLECNGATLVGNGTTNLRGIYTSGRNNITIQNCSLVNYNMAMLIVNTNSTILTSAFNNNSRGIEFQGGFSNTTVLGSNFTNNTYSGIRFNSASLLTGVIIESNNFNLYSAGIKGDLNSSGIILKHNTFNILGSSTSPAIWDLIGSSWNIDGNLINGNGIAGSYGISLRDINTVSKNNIIQYLQYPIDLQGAKNFTSINDTSQNNDEGLFIEALTDGAYFYNTTIKNSTQNYDTYNVGVKIINSSNILFNNPNITEIATIGILLQGTNNVSLINPNFDFIPLSQRNNYLADDGFEPRCAIQSTKYYKGFYQNFGNTNLTIIGATFDSDTPCYLHLENQTLLSFDSSINNYWYRSFSYNNSINGIIEFYIPNNQMNLSGFRKSTNSTNYQFNLGGGSGTGCSLSTCKYLAYNESQTFSYYKNINTTATFQLTKNNLTNALSEYGNLTGFSLINGAMNFTLQSLQDITFLENFNITEGVSRLFSPLNIISTSNSNSDPNTYASQFTYNVNSSLSNSVSGIQFYPIGGITCPSSIKYTSSTGTTAVTFSCAGGFITQIFAGQYDPLINSVTLNYNKDNSNPTGGGSSTGGTEQTDSGYNSTIICNFVYDYLVSKQGQKIYTDAELTSLTNMINANSVVPIQSSTTATFIDQFETKCGKSLPTPKTNNETSNFTFYNWSSSISPCTPDINSSLTVMNANFNMDSSLPFFNIDMGQASCPTIELTRWIFKIEKNVDTYTITGIKLWWLMSLFLVVSVLLIYRSAKKNSKKKSAGFLKPNATQSYYRR